MVLRTVLDVLAILGAYAFTHSATGSVWTAVISGVAAGAYGVWCYYDGLLVGRRTAAME